ncbi:hypothetical protein LVJ94_23335 [Pendulispora rubella]|uniref:Uncharacterized protein n=1 Tax=Pendulispora rubella TaxID=2741070 RepID=A0ABZ2LGT1_9BACT
MTHRTIHLPSVVSAFVLATLVSSSAGAQAPPQAPPPSPPQQEPAPPPAPAPSSAPEMTPVSPAQNPPPAETPPPSPPAATATAAPPAQTPPPAPAPAAPAAPPASAAPATTPAPAPAGKPPPRPNGKGKRGFASVSEFARSPYTVKIGDPESEWKISIYGFIEFDIMHDSTRSYNDSAGSTVIQREDVLAGQKGRTTFTARNSRLGFRMESPEFHGIRPSAVLEGDFMGNQPPNISESQLFNNPTFRVRHAYVRLLNDYVDVLGGESYVLFGAQPYFFPASVQYLPVPNQVLHRSMQLRLSHTFKTDPITVDIGAAAVRPIQRDSTLPEGQAALRIIANNWKGLHTPGSLGTTADGAALSVSGLVRSFRVNEFSANPTTTKTETGWGVSIDALLPVIPVPDADKRGNALTLNGSFVVGGSIADQMGMTAGVTQPPLPNPPGGTYTSDVDNGLVVYDRGGTLHTVDWRSFVVGMQYYLPPSGRVFISSNFTQGESRNVTGLVTDPAQMRSVYRLQRYFDANIFLDITPAARIALSYQWTWQRFLDGASAENQRYMFGMYYLF